MQLLNRNFWWVWLVLYILTGSGLGAIFILGFLLDIYEKDAWYTKLHNWIIGLGIFSLIVFSIEILTKIASKLKIDGEEFYLSPYAWILMFIIPIFGWLMLATTVFYLEIMILISIYEGKAEKYGK